MDDRRNRRNTPIVVAALSVVLHVLSLAQCAWRFLPDAQRYSLMIPFAGVAVSLLAFSIAGFFIRPRLVRIALLIVRAFAISLLIAPVSDYNAIKPPLLFAFFFESGFSLGLPDSVALSTLSALFVVGLSQNSVPGHPATLLHSPADFMLQCVLYAVFFVVGILLRKIQSRQTSTSEMVTRLEDSIKRLTDANTGFQQYLRIAEENSKSDERNRIIRELHDSLGYTFTTIIMLSESGIERSHQGSVKVVRSLFETIRDNAKSGLTDIRIALRLLKSRSDRTSDLNALLRLTKAFEKATNVRVRCSLGNAPFWFGGSVDGIVFRIIQEGMVNAFRHGKATEIDISLSVAEGSFQVAVRDNGNGSAEVEEGIGILSMKEEIEAAGGRLEYGSSPFGFSLAATVPLAVSQPTASLGSPP